MRSKDGVITFMAIGALTGERIKKLTEMEIRQGIGCLLELTFALRLEATHIYKLVISSEWGSH